MPRTDLPASIGLILFGAFVVYESWRMPRFERIGGTIYSAPGLVPGILGAVVALLGVVMLLRYLAARGAARSAAAFAHAEAGSGSTGLPLAAAEGAQAEEAPAEEQARPSTARLLWTLGLTVVYAAGLVGRLPFWLATFLFVFTYIVVFERSGYEDAASTLRGLAFAAGIAAATAFAVPFVFERIFLVNLP